MFGLNYIRLCTFRAHVNVRFELCKAFDNTLRQLYRRAVTVEDTVFLVLTEDHNNH